MINSSKLITYITLEYVRNGSWRDTTKIFVLDCEYQIWLYKILVDISDHFSGVQKHTMLDNVVEPIPSL